MLPAATESLDLDPWVWWVTIGVAVAVLAFDVVWIARNPHRPSNRETGIALSIYVGAAILFGLGMWYFAGAQLAGEYFAGWLTEYSLSVDNLFIFLLIMAKFAVPEKLQQFALMIGIIIAIVLRGLFIWLGAAAIENFSWVFYIFGAFLIYTAVKLAREGESDDDEYEENRFMRWVESRFPATQAYQGTKLFIVENGKRLATPLFFVIIALGTTDLLFALDSIPAIYGLTREPYIVLVGQPLRPHGSAPAVLPARRPAPEARLPQPGPGRAARLHRRQAAPPRPAHQRAAVHQRRRERAGPGDPDLDVARRHRRSSSARRPSPACSRPARTSASSARRLTRPQAAPSRRQVFAVSAGSGSRRAQPQDEGGCRDDERHPEQLGRAEHLAEHDEPGERREGRLEAEQDAEHLGAHPAQREQLERVGEHRRQHGDPQTLEQRLAGPRAARS